MRFGDAADRSKIENGDDLGDHLRFASMDSHEALVWMLMFGEGDAEGTGDVFRLTSDLHHLTRWIGIERDQIIADEEASDGRFVLGMPAVFGDELVALYVLMERRMNMAPVFLTLMPTVRQI